MSRFQEFWEAWPGNGQPPFTENVRKKNRKGCEKKWVASKFDEKADSIIRDVQNRAKYDKLWRQNKGAFLPLPLTYLNQEQWNDGGFADVRDQKHERAKAPSAKNFDTGPNLSKYARFANLALLKKLLTLKGTGSSPTECSESLARAVRGKNEVVRLAEDESWENEDFKSVIFKTIDDALDHHGQA